MTDAHYEQLIRGCNILAAENAQLRRLMADAEDELAERRGRARQEDRLRAAWQSTILEARRQAARADTAEARLAELEDDDAGDWMSGMLWARKLSILNVPLVSPAFTGDTTDPWATAAEAARQHELVKQRLAEHLATNPVPGVEPSTGVVLRPGIPAPASPGALRKLNRLYDAISGSASAEARP